MQKERIMHMWMWTTVVGLDLALLRHVRNKVDGHTDSVWVPLGMTALYFMMIMHGRRWMRFREPFDMRTGMVIYNLYQTAINAFMVAGLIMEVQSSGMRWWGSGIERSARGHTLGFLLYAHYHNKYVEYMDTVFMVLRKKDRQISFLHVYHHVLMTWSWFAVLRWGPGGDAWFGACCNSLIHVLMYSYYLLRTLGVPCPWKKMLTQMQMLQFGFCFGHSVYVGLFCDAGTYPCFLTTLQMFVMVNMLVLFGNFYQQQYT